MIDTQAIRNKILDLAMRGQLTEQLPEDGSVEELYQQIQNGKADILRDRNGRNDKNIKDVDEDVPYGIPSQWKWIRFGEIGLYKKGPFGSALTKSMFVPKSSDTIKVYEQQHAIRKDSTLGTYYITKQYFDEKMNGFEVKPGDILISCAGTIGETYIMPDGIEQGIINQALMRVTLAPGVNKSFFQYYFDANLKGSARSGNGSAIINIPPFDVIKNWYFPLAPFAEQQRIVDKIDQAFSVLDTIDALQTQYADNLTALKNKLIDAAIQGRLTEHLPEDGTAEELYQRIQTEKQALIKTGKIKKEKPLPEIKDEEVPFGIPDNWKWVRLGAISQQITDGTHRTPTYQKEGVPFLSVKNISSGYLDLSDIKYIPVDEHTELIKRCKPERNDVLVCRIGTLGKALRIDTDLSFSIFVSLGLIKTGNETLSDHIVSVINSGYGAGWIQSIKAGGAMHAYKINLTDLNLLPVPLAPLAEQKRIKEKLKLLFSGLGL